MTKDRKPDFEIVVFGATGFTGRLIAEYLNKKSQAGTETFRWAIAGRSETKLQALADELQLGDVPKLIANSSDADSLRQLAARTRVVISTVGPYAVHGEPLVAACAESGTHYCDLTGEVLFIRRSIDRYERAAKQSGARIVHSCGYDSIPSDLGTLYAQDLMQKRFGRLPDRVVAGAGASRGGFSGGTAASLLNVIKELKADPSVKRVLADPCSLNPEGTTMRAQGDQMGVRYDRLLRGWTAPFIMASINSRVVRRSQALLGRGGATGVEYHECMTFGPGMKGAFSAAMVTLATGAFAPLLFFGPTRRMIEKKLPQPGEGPDLQTRESGYFNHHLVAAAGSDQVEVLVHGDKDPGYGATAKMLSESALCLALDGAALQSGPGILTPASAMGTRLLERLQKVGIRFSEGPSTPGVA